MRDEHTAPLYFDDIEDALRDVVRAAGGPKQVGARLWPEIEPDKAGRRLADCLNEARREVLSPAQVMLILKIGRQVGCHAAINYMARDAGYSDPMPIEPEDEVTRLQREFVEATKALGSMAARIEEVQLQARDAAGCMIGYDDDEDAMPLGFFIGLLCLVAAAVCGVAVMMVGLVLSIDMAAALDPEGLWSWIVQLLGLPA